MPVTATVTTRFRPVQRFADNAASIAATMGGELIQRTAQQLVPVDTGALRASIDHERDQGSRPGHEIEIVHTGSGRDGRNYGGYVEFGTSRNRAQPYLVPAAVISTEPIMRILADAFFSQG